MRKLIFGETWRLPVGIACAVLTGVAVRTLLGSDALWRDGGGVVLVVGVAVALWLSLRA